MKINISSLIEKNFPPTGRAKKRNANIRQFAKAIDVDEASAAKIYDGNIDSIRMSTLENICKALNCTPLDVFTPEDQFIARLLTNQRIILNHKNNKDDTF